MKKFLIGFICGAGLSVCSVIFAADSIQAILFPVTFEINGKHAAPSSEYAVLNYNDHVYVPIRFVAESLGLGVKYEDKDRTISIQNEPSNTDEPAHKVWLIQYRLNVGQDRDSVKELLGNPTSVQFNDAKKQETWRYDFSPKPNYSYTGSNIDVKGLEQGQLGAQLFVYWTKEDKLDLIELWYTIGSDKSIHTHYIYPDGSTAGALFE